MKLLDAQFRLKDVDPGATPQTLPDLDQLQEDVHRIHQHYHFNGLKGLVVFEGWDAAGKGGTIRRLTNRLDPRSVKVWSTGPPSRYERQRHYLHRFWQRLPPEGAWAVFDRSWYGRVLVERVEGLASGPEWMRAYDEINEFERLLSDDGVRIVKLFLHISPEEQLRRFKARFESPAKRWKLTAEDFRNRERHRDYQAAFEEMVQRTSTDYAPWTVIGGDHKRKARLHALACIAESLSDGLEIAYPSADPEVRALARKHF